ncbi:hypothetical protein [Pusillimonas sp. ANT_WB101]|uniref:hypothetical protein n=1 Tax=Pusillimonas sp. ANT_WB101 TaxID=2597356 RepID=UPI0011EF213D|nr:hypothetical protein [Pusillimonas sp. ANT_WB101]KAA0890570.1 hypothetical protein FQ179_12855 [Pusillimonas sp. ANT_WB101]NYT75379.1 hypothetical protein [Alcaligenaceae bacterium]
MLQDLDSLAARIGQLVQFTRQLQDERAAMQTRLKTLEQDCEAFRQQLQRREDEFSVVTERNATHEAQIQSLQAETQASHAQLQAEVARYKADCEEARRQLEASQADTSRLRQVADKARTQIDSILVRLPGAPQE